MIYTVTLNPAVDRELTVPAIEFDTVLRATEQRVDCGGKGFNVSRMVAQLGGENVALGFAGGRSGEMLRDMLHERGIATDFVWVDGETRTNVSIVTAGKHIKVNESGAAVSAEKQQLLIDTIQKHAKRDDWWVLAGSLPPGVSADFYAQLISILKTAGANVILDASGEALRLGVAAAPNLIKPNEHEASDLTGESDPKAAAQAIMQMGVANVIISLGADGILLVQDDAITHIQPPPIEEANPIGAGDALVGGVVWALDSGLSLADAAYWGIACGTVAATLPGTAFGNRAQVEEVVGQLQRDSR